jgi:hypothetical protein
VTSFDPLIVSEPQGPQGPQGQSGPPGPAGGVISIDGQIGAIDLSGNYGPGGTAGNINKATAQGVALVQALIFGS